MTEIPTNTNSGSGNAAPATAPIPIPTKIVEVALIKFAAEREHSDDLVAALRAVLISDGAPNAEAILSALASPGATCEAA